MSSGSLRAALAAMLVLALAPDGAWAQGQGLRLDRSLGAPAVLDRLGSAFKQIRGGSVVPVAPPPIIGLGTGGGFAFVLQDLRG